MRLDAIAKLVQDYSSYFVLLLSLIGLLGGFSAGLCAPSKRRRQGEGRRVNYMRALNQRDHGRSHMIGDPQQLGRRRGGSPRDHHGGTSSCDQSREPQMKVVVSEKIEEETKLPRMSKAKGFQKQRSESNPRFLWLRSLSLRNKEKTAAPGRSKSCTEEEEEESKGTGGMPMQRKASLTGDEVKEMADAFIARMRQRLRLQRQESYEARLDRSS